MTGTSETVSGALLGGVCEAACLALGAAGASVALLDETGADLVFVAVAGEAAESLVGARFPAREGIAGHALQTGELVEAAHASRDPHFARDVAAEIGYSPEALVVAPLRDGGRLVGVLSVLDPQSAKSSDRHARLAILCRYAEAALQVERELERDT